MSFSLDVKTDLLNFNSDNILADKLEIESMIRISGEIGIVPLSISLTSNNSGIIRRFVSLIKKYYDVETDILKRVIDRFDSHTNYTAIINKGADIIINDLNLLHESSNYRQDLDERLIEAYLRGAFLVRGSVNDPSSKTNHLEISSTSESEIIFLQRLMNNFELNARISKRKNYLVLYIKAIDSIADFLYHIGCNQIMEKFQDIVITKKLKTNAKRSVNLDLANQEKTNSAAKMQVKYIKVIEYNYPLEKIDQKILMVMKVRLDYPDYSLNDLLTVIHNEYDPDLTKSGLNHRFRKIKQMAIDLKKSNK